MYDGDFFINTPYQQVRGMGSFRSSSREFFDTECSKYGVDGGDNFGTDCSNLDTDCSSHSMDGDVFESFRVATFNISSSIIWSMACWHYTAKASAQHWHSGATVFPEFR